MFTSFARSERIKENRSSMRKNSIRTQIAILLCVFSLLTVLCACGSSSAEAPSETPEAESETPPSDTENALNAYRDILSAAPAVEGSPDEWADASFGYEQNREAFGDHYELFALADLSRDGVPELIAQRTVNFRWTSLSVFTYANGEAVWLKNPSDTNGHATFEQNSAANGAYVTYFCENGHIHSVWRGADPFGNALEENHAYAQDGTALIEVECSIGEGENTVDFYDIAMANTPENAQGITYPHG